MPCERPPRKRSPVMCEQCGTVIGRKSDMPRHMRLHSADKLNLMHRCPYDGCLYKSLQRSNVETHIRTHTGEILYCPDCDFITRDPGSLTRHRKRLHSYQPKARHRAGKVPPAKSTPRHTPYTRVDSRAPVVTAPSSPISGDATSPEASTSASTSGTVTSDSSTADLSLFFAPSDLDYEYLAAALVAAQQGYHVNAYTAQMPPPPPIPQPKLDCLPCPIVKDGFAPIELPDLSYTKSNTPPLPVPLVAAAAPPAPAAPLAPINLPVVAQVPVTASSLVSPPISASASSPHPKQLIPTIDSGILSLLTHPSLVHGGWLYIFLQTVLLPLITPLIGNLKNCQMRDTMSNFLRQPSDFQRDPFQIPQPQPQYIPTPNCPSCTPNTWTEPLNSSFLDPPFCPQQQPQYIQNPSANFPPALDASCSPPFSQDQACESFDWSPLIQELQNLQGQRGFIDQLQGGGGSTPGTFTPEYFFDTSLASTPDSSAVPTPPEYGLDGPGFTQEDIQWWLNGGRGFAA